MYNKDNIIGLQFEVSKTIYIVEPGYLIRNTSSNWVSKRGDYSADSLAKKFNSGLWKVINNNIIHEVW